MTIGHAGVQAHIIVNRVGYFQQPVIGGGLGALDFNTQPDSRLSKSLIEFAGQWVNVGGGSHIGYGEFSAFVF